MINSTNSAADRAREARQAIADLIQSGSIPATELDKLRQAHPDLLPEIEAELAKLRLIEAARDLATKYAADPPLDLAGRSDTPQGRVLRCPHCRCVVTSPDWESETFVCQTCGGHFLGLDDRGADSTEEISGPPSRRVPTT